LACSAFSYTPPRSLSSELNSLLNSSALPLLEERKVVKEIDTWTARKKDVMYVWIQRASVGVPI